MQASIARNTSWLRSAATGGCTLLAVFALAVVLTGIAGCPPTPPPQPAGCETNEDCDDGRFCNGEETCEIDSNGDGTCVDGEPPCPAEDCVENADFCPECSEDADCDDGDECTDDVCNDQRECESTNNTAACDDGNPCTSDDACADGECAGTPNTDACDDGDACTENDACADGACAGTPVECAEGETCNPATGECEGVVTECTSNGDCDDGLFCNGEETCGTNGVCEDGTAPCPAEDCNEDADTCQAECTSDADCDDGLFCTGAETCGTNGFCEAGTDPCAADEDCLEGDDGPICTPQIGVTLNFTLGQDNLIGTGDADTFSAALEFNAGTGAQISTFQNGDSAQGLAGDDTLNATYNNLTGADQTLAPTLGGIETLNFSDFGDGADDTFISGVNFTGVTAVNSLNSLTDVFVEDLNALANLGVRNTAFDLDVTFISPAGNGTSDAITLTLNNARDNGPGNDACSVFINTPANGLETLNVVSAGNENKLEELDGGAATLLTMNVSGSAPLTIRRDAPLNGSLTTINAAMATGATDLTVGGAANVTYTGGTGNDTINFAGTYTTSDTINGGAGTNTLGLNANLAAVASTQSNVSGIQTLMIVNTLLGETIDVTRFGASDAILDSTGAALLLNLPSNMTLGSGNRTITFNNDDLNDQFNVTVSGVGTSDTLTMNFFNADQSFAATQIDTIGAETLEVVSGNGLDGTAADGNANQVLNLDMTPTTGTGTINITGTVAFTVLQGITAGTVTAANAGAAFTMETTSCTLNLAGGSVTGSPFNDELTGGAGNDSINGGDGNDIIKGNDGSDVTAGGNGTDRFFFDAVTQFGAALNHATPEVISDLTQGTDKVGLGSGIIDFAGIAGTEAAPLALTSANFETGRAAITAIIAGDAFKIVRISAELTGNDIDTTVGFAVAAYVLVFDSTAGRGFLVHDDNWSDVANRRFVRLENITTNAQLQALTFTDFEEID